MEMQQTAFLLEEDERAGDTFRMSLGNVSAHSLVRVSLKYVQQLKLVEPPANSEPIAHKPQILNLTLPCVLNPRYDPSEWRLFLSVLETRTVHNLPKRPIRSQRRQFQGGRLVELVSLCVLLRGAHSRLHAH